MKGNLRIRELKSKLLTVGFSSVYREGEQNVGNDNWREQFQPLCIHEMYAAGERVGEK